MSLPSPKERFLSLGLPKHEIVLFCVREDVRVVCFGAKVCVEMTCVWANGPTSGRVSERVRVSEMVRCGCKWE